MCLRLAFSNFFIVSFYPIPLGLSSTSFFSLRGNGNHCQLCGLSIRLTHIFSTYFGEARNLCEDAFISFFHFDHCYTTNIDVVPWVYCNVLSF